MVRASKTRFLVAVTATTMAGAVALAPTATQAQAPPGLITYSSGFVLIDPDLDNNSQVFTVRPDGSQVRQLTHVPADKQAGAPDLSPDGQTIVYSSNQGGDRFAVYAMNSDGSGQHKLFGQQGYDFFQPRWSPDGSKLVVTRCDLRFGFTASCAIVLTSLDYQQHSSLFDQNRTSGDPAFSPDGTWVAFDSDRGGYQSAIWKIKVDGSHLTRLTDPKLLAFWPNWSPNGKRIVFSSNCCRPTSQLYTMRNTGTQLTQLSHGTAGDAAFASYSPDGSQIVYSTNQDTGAAREVLDVYAIKTDGTGRHLISEGTPNAVGPDWVQGTE